MKKVSLFFLSLFLFSFGLIATEVSVHYYIGEMNCIQPNEEHHRHYGLFFLKRTLIPDENRFIDSCFLKSPEDGYLELEQISVLEGDFNQTIVTSPDGLITGSGELVGFPWEWTNLKEHMQLSDDNPVSVEVENRIHEDYILSIANVYFAEHVGEKELLATFTAKLYKVDKKTLERFFNGSSAVPK